MQDSLTRLLAVCCLGFASLATPTAASAQDLRRVALKSGESIEFDTVYYVINCRSVMTGVPEIEVLEGPPEVTLTIKAGPVVPRRFGCAKEVPGGTIVATANNVKESKIAKLFYRVKYKTREGDRQTANDYYVGLFP
jgi:hypothetical protein